MNTAIWWIRRDLRLNDNLALQTALASEQVIPLFIVDPFFEQSASISARRWLFLLGGLQALSSALKQRGSRLIVRRGEPVQVLTQLCAETRTEQIVAEADYSGYARRRDARVARNLPLHLVEGVTVHHPDRLLKADGKPYQVFTPFKKRAWLARPLPTVNDILPAPGRIVTPATIHSQPLPQPPAVSPALQFVPGEIEALRRLETFCVGPVSHYQEARNLVAESGTSQLSPYLRLGMISARQCVVAALSARRSAPDDKARAGADTWLNELIWREFYVAILYHYPHVARGSFRPEYDGILWQNHPADFAAWQQGRTGFPIVDAAMQQLNQTGWMHNRARMISASFLVKDLLIDWRWGERYFMQQLLDGDPASNNGGWQWTAGTGTDAAPYFRIFNPISQSQKFDPEGRYLARWLPALASLPPRYRHTPWLLPAPEQERLGFAPGRDFPLPIIEHKLARERTLHAYRAARAAAGR